MKTLFWINKNRKNEKEECTIMLRFTYRKERVNVATTVKTPLSKWNSTKQRIKGTNENCKSLNKLLQSYQNKALNAYNELLEEHDSFSVKDIVKRFNGEDSKEIGFIEAFEKYIINMQQRLGVDVAYSTLKSYKSTLRNLNNFITSVCKVSDLPIKRFDKSKILDFEQYLKGHKRFKNNYVVKNMEHLRKIFNYCMTYNQVKENPFKNVSFKKIQTTKDFLSMEELQTLINYTPQSERMKTTKDVFLFMCFTGLAHVDARKVNYTNVKVGVDKEPWLELRRTKTDNLVLVPILPLVKQLIKKYSNHPICIKRGTLMPVPANQTLNRSLKMLTTEIGLTKSLSTHCGRYTFASTVLLANGIRMEVAQKMLAHKSIKSTAVYAKLSEYTLSKEISGLNTLLPMFNDDPTKPDVNTKSLHILN